LDSGDIFGIIKKSKFAWIVCVLIIIPISILLTLTGGCLSFILIALVTFGIPFLFGIRSTKTLLKIGVLAIIMTGIIFGVIYTHLMFNQLYYFEHVPLDNGQLEGGTVTPYTGDDNTTFNYTIRYTGSEALENITVYVNITDFSGGDKFVIPLENSGRLFYNETKLNQSIYYYHFTAYLSVQIIQGVLYLLLDSGIFFFMIVVLYYWRKTTQKQQAEWEEKMKNEEEEIKKEKEKLKEEEPKVKVVEFECTSCGAVVEADADVCPKCGEDFEGEEEEERKGGEGEEEKKAED
jgi:predicted RNA-binding Zn-ribbon protein involved in translation (DUF1610 family)